jgi:hypothetical protein
MFSPDDDYTLSPGSLTSDIMVTVLVLLFSSPLLAMAFYLICLAVGIEKETF